MSRRLTRSVAFLAALAATTAAAVPTVALAAGGEGQSRSYHVIRSTLGNAGLDVTDGCLRTEVFAASSVAKYGSQPGPVNKQGATDVLVRVTDTCAVVVAALPPGGGTVLAEYDARTDTPLVADPRLRDAAVSTVLTDTDDPDVTIRLDVRWVGTGPLQHDTGSTHELYPGVGVTSSATNDIRRAATAQVSVVVEAAGEVLVDVSGTDEEALLETVRFHCVEVPRPGVDEFYPCFGFPA